MFLRSELMLTIALGASFLMLQSSEYYDAFTKDGLTLNAGVYGSTFFLLTGFHGIHVLIGTIMLLVILGRRPGGPFHPGEALRLSGCQLVLALRGRGLVAAIRFRPTGFSRSPDSLVDKGLQPFSNVRRVHVAAAFGLRR